MHTVHLRLLAPIATFLLFGCGSSGGHPAGSTGGSSGTSAAHGTSDTTSAGGGTSGTSGSAATGGAGTGGAGIVDAADGTTGVLYEPDPVTNPDDMDSYPHLIRLAHSGSANGTILATFERQLQTSTNPGRGWLIYQSTDGGAHFAQLGAPVQPVHFTSATNALQPNLLELAHPAGALPAGTVLLSGNTGSGTQLELQVFQSADHGASFQYLGTIDSTDTSVDPRRVWEPFVMQLDDGRLVAYYSDELTPGGQQNVVGKVSTDGGATWGPKASAWQSTNTTDRPGMATVARMGNGQYVMSVEMCGAPGDFCRAHYKTSTDGLTWGAGPQDMGTRAVATTGHPFHGTPFIAWTPAGGPQGTLILSARALMESVSMPNTQAGGFGQTLLVNYGEGDGSWYELTAPVPWTAGPMETQAGYRSALLPSTDGSSILYLTTTYTGQGVRNRILYAVANAGVLPYADPFAAGSSAGWQEFGGAWSVSAGVYTDSQGGAGDKAVAGSTEWTDYTLEGDVEVTGQGNAGFLIRVTDPNVGVDAHNGYYVGISSADGTVFLGREQYDWTMLGTAQTLPGGVSAGAWYHLSVQAMGCSFTVSAQPEGSTSSPLTFTETDPGCAQTFGAIGVRTFQTPAAFRNVAVTAAGP